MLITGQTSEDGLNQRWWLLRDTLFRGDTHFVRGLCDLLLGHQEGRFVTTDTARRAHFLDGRTANIFWRILDLHFRSELNTTSRCHLDYGELSTAFRRHLGAFVNLHPFFPTTARGSLETGLKVYNPGSWEEEAIHQRPRRERQQRGAGSRR